MFRVLGLFKTHLLSKISDPNTLFLLIDGCLSYLPVMLVLMDNVLSDVVESWDSIGVYSILRTEHGKLSGAV